MRSPFSQLVRNAGCLTGLLVVLGALPGCQTLVDSSNGAEVRIIDASPDAPGIDSYQGGRAMAYNLGFGTITSYVSIAPGTSAIRAVTAGSKQELSSARGSFATAARYTVLIGNVAAGLEETVLTDQSQPAPAGKTSLRVLDQETGFAGGVDVYLVPAGATIGSVAPILTNVVFGSNSGYINVPVGTYTVVLLPTGRAATSSSAAIYNGIETSYPAGAARTLILLDEPGLAQPGFQLLVAKDYDPDGA
ncbi:MAG TPA: DUF4397 domain-containing protein [Granulicella sp.]|jgi:hypothetical protein|nr:DUF4397 domain-containing protein [Granulicella sp.]